MTAKERIQNIFADVGKIDFPGFVATREVLERHLTAHAAEAVAEDRKNRECCRVAVKEALERAVLAVKGVPPTAHPESGDISLGLALVAIRSAANPEPQGPFEDCRCWTMHGPGDWRKYPQGDSYTYWYVDAGHRYCPFCGHPRRPEGK